MGQINGVESKWAESKHPTKKKYRTFPNNKPRNNNHLLSIVCTRKKKKQEFSRQLQLVHPVSCFVPFSSMSSSHWDFSSESEGWWSCGRVRLVWRFHSLWSSVTSASLLLVPLSLKLARGGRTFTPFTVTEPSMALRSYDTQGFYRLTHFH